MEGHDERRAERMTTSDLMLGDELDEPVCTHCGMTRVPGGCGMIWCPEGSRIEDDADEDGYPNA